MDLRERQEEIWDRRRGRRQTHRWEDNVRMEAEAGMTAHEAQECWDSHPKLEGPPGEHCPGRLQTSSLPNCERINFYCFMPPGLPVCYSSCKASTHPPALGIRMHPWLQWNIQTYLAKETGGLAWFPPGISTMGTITIKFTHHWRQQYWLIRLWRWITVLFLREWAGGWGCIDFYISILFQSYPCSRSNNIKTHKPS